MQSIELSIIIVNYHVKHFLAQCLLSVFRALKHVSGEVIVVDNNSQDGSQLMLKERFGEKIILIENKDNPGFSKANNQGIKLAKGKYVLLLNPDTIVEEQTFRKCVDFMETHAEAGALGVKMIDGQGIFLPESKRALPTPWVSFYKIFGLSRLFPKSKRFGKYHLTYLDKNQTHEVEILSGAFMFMRKELLDDIGYLDETFFMYGEDIDLSYRILLAQYKNYYLAHTQILHYKGESTKKGSLNYVRIFYQAMIIFAKKHFGGSKKQLFILAIRLAVYLRALIAIFRRITSILIFPLIEGLLIYATMFGIKEYWEHYVKFIVGGNYYPDIFTYGYMPIYSLVFVSFLWLAGAYKKPYHLRPLVLAPFFAFISIATVTYMFPAVLNFSRAIVGLSAVFTMLIALGTRGLIHRRQKGTFFFTEHHSRRALILGSPTGLPEAFELIKGELRYYPVDIIGYVCSQDIEALGSDLDRLGEVDQLLEIILLFQVDEVIVANENFPTAQIFHLLTKLSSLPVEVKIIPPKSNFMLGPQTIYTSPYLRHAHYRIQGTVAKQAKRMVDLFGSISLLLSFPFLFWVYKQPLKTLKELWQVFINKKHLVGYISSQAANLPPLKPALLHLLHRTKKTQTSPKINLSSLDQLYARSWSWELELEIIWKSWPRIGNKN